MTAEERIKQLEEENASLKEENASFKEDPFIGFYFSQIRKLREYTKALNKYTINDLEKDDSEAFDKYIKIAEKNGLIISNILSLEKIIKERFGITEIKDEKKSIPDIEHFAKNKKDKK